VIGGVIGGVGQRMLIGVAKKMAGEFFRAVDDVLTGNRAPAPVEHTGSGRGHAEQIAAGSGQPAAVFASAGRPSPGAQPVTESFFAGAVFGAVTALLGVLVGARTARLNRRSD
jgi:hypothetical protein